MKLNREGDAVTTPVDTEEVRRARQAAEALFSQKPIVPVVQAENGAAAEGVTENAPRRPPRVFSLAAVVPVREEVPDRSATAEPSCKSPAPHRRSRIPRSQHGRIKALATYGMSVEAVAELYEVPADEIARLVTMPADS